MKRSSAKIRGVLVSQELTIRKVAEGLGVSHTLVSRTIRGEINNRRVLRELLEIGVPARFLALPNDMREAA